MSGCGYLPPDPNAFPWEPTGRQACHDEYDPKTGRLHLPICPGYLCALPEVIEASHAYLFLKNGGVTQYTQGDPPSEPLLVAVTTLESEYDKLVTTRAQERAKAAQR